MTERVTVIIPTYNYARFLPTAIESVLAQTRPADEIIVVDDGSTDNSAEIIAGYADRGVRCIYQENKGVSAARNLAIRESTGEFVTFLDADDEWLPDKLALQLAHFKANPQVGLVTGGEWEFDDAGSAAPWLSLKRGVDAEWLYPRILIENLVGTPSLVMIRRECFSKAGLFDEQFGLGQDWDLWIRIAKNYPIGVIDKPLIRYRRHDASMSEGPVWRRYQSNRAFQRRHIRPIRDSRLRARLLFSAQSMNFFYAAAYLKEGGQQRWLTFALSALSVVMDPVYQARLKWALLLRSGLGNKRAL